MNTKFITYQANSLKNQLLIATPSLNGSDFSQTVTYICEHNDKGAMGIIINKPSPMSLGDILKQLDIEFKDKEEIGSYPVLSGGPVAQEQGFLIHQTQSIESPPSSGAAIIDDENNIVVSASKDLLSEFAQGQGPDNLLISLGYAGWEKGQLEYELKANHWLLAPADMKILFNVPYAERWKAAAATIGVDFDRMVSQSGSA